MARTLSSSRPNGDVTFLLLCVKTERRNFANLLSFVTSRWEDVVGVLRNPTRKSMRYPVKAPVSFWWKDENGNQCQGEGTSRDVSETGTFVFAPGCPPVGADIALRIFLVALPGATTRIVRMEVDGRVLRVEQATAAGRCGFAVLTKDAILRENVESTREENPSSNDATRINSG
jgi:hypothetical protein